MFTYQTWSYSYDADFADSGLPRPVRKKPVRRWEHAHKRVTGRRMKRRKTYGRSCEIPAGPLRDIAYRIPADTLAAMSPIEAECRASYVHELQSRADSEPSDKAARTRKLAEKVIRSVSSQSYSAHYARLSRELSEANLRGDSPAAYEAYAALRQLERDNPPVPAPRVVAHANAVVVRELDKLKIPRVRLPKRCLISGCFGHAARLRRSMVSSS